MILRRMVKIKSNFGKGLFSLLLMLLAHSLAAQWNFETKFFKIAIDNKGYITSMKNNLPGSASYQREFSPADKPSPLLCLYAFKKKVYYLPQSASYQAPDLQLTYTNGIIATVEIQVNVAGNSYIRFKLKSLSERKDIDDIQWGPVNTNITNILGDIIGVAKDTSDAVNYAIGMFAINDNTCAGPSYVDGDLPTMFLQIHSPHPSIPVPPPYKEGQRFPIGGTCDVCFYGGVKPYTKFKSGNAGELDEYGRVSFYYHSMDRRKKRTVLLKYQPFESPIWGASNDHIEVAPVPTEDCVGSTVAFYGAPEDMALKEVLEKVVLNEGMLHLTSSGNGSTVEKWMRDPARTLPAITVNSRTYDFNKIIDMVSKMGFSHVLLGAELLKVERSNGGSIPKYELNAGGKMTPIKEVSKLADARNVIIGDHTYTNRIHYGSSDIQPIPNEHLACLYERKLVKGICRTSAEIEVDNPLYFNELASWECDDTDMNFIKIGTEIIRYLGISKKPPYILQNISRGYLGTVAQPHPPGAAVCRLACTFGAGYNGLVPDLTLLKQYGEYYADMAINSGIKAFDCDGLEFLDDTGHGPYAYKTFFKAMQQKANAHNIPLIRSSASAFTDGSWLYQTVANYGSENNVFDTRNRTFRPQGIAMNNAGLGNYFPSSFSGVVDGIHENSTVQFFEDLEAMSVGVNASYGMTIIPSEVEKCKVKEAIFAAIKTWECARAANAFPREVLQKLRIPTRHWHLKGIDNDTWELYQVNADKSQILFKTLKRDPNY